MGRRSAGLIMYRLRAGRIEILLAHMGGPYWAKKDLGAWSIPKGEYAREENPLEAAKREFCEETGIHPEGDFLPLSPLRQPGGKTVSAWAFEGDCEAGGIKSNTFAMEWPPRSGKVAEFPEVDRAEWFTANLAKKKILKGQVGFIEELCRRLGYEESEEDPS